MKKLSPFERLYAGNLYAPLNKQFYNNNCILSDEGDFPASRYFPASYLVLASVITDNTVLSFANILSHLRTYNIVPLSFYPKEK